MSIIGMASVNNRYVSVIGSLRYFVCLWQLNALPMDVAMYLVSTSAEPKEIY